MADDYGSTDQLFCGQRNITGLLSYIRLGRPRRVQDYTSSPTIANPSGHYIWDFINWGLTTPHGLEALSNVTPNEKDIVPFSEMDQGRLFVRVSVQDLATLQLAYQRGLAALQRAQNRAGRLKEENNNLQSAARGWSLKTTELTMETIKLRQEIASLKSKQKTGSITIDEHNELLDLLCRNICHMIQGGPNIQCWQASAFNDLLKLVFALPVKLHEKLSHMCPNFNKLLNCTEPSSIVLSDAMTNIERILQLVPPPVENTLLHTLVRKLQRRNATVTSTETIKVTEGGSSKSLGVNSELTSSADMRKTILKQPRSRQDSKQNESSDIDSCSISRPDLPPRRYSITELKSPAKSDSSLHLTPSSKSVATSASRAIERLDSLVHGTVTDPTSQLSVDTENLSKEPVYAEVIINDQSATQNRDSKSQSSGIGTPLAHSTPFGTLTTLVTPKHQLNTKTARKRRKRKVSRWNFAARFCSSGRSTTMSDSESMESAIFLQATRPQAKIIKHHGRRVKGYKWFFKINKH